MDVRQAPKPQSLTIEAATFLLSPDSLEETTLDLFDLSPVPVERGAASDLMTFEGGILSVGALVFACIIIRRSFLFLFQ